MGQDGYVETGGDGEAHGVCEDKPPTAAAVFAPTKLQRMTIIKQASEVDLKEAEGREYWPYLFSPSCSLKGNYIDV